MCLNILLQAAKTTEAIANTPVSDKEGPVTKDNTKVKTSTKHGNRTGDP